MIAELKLTRAQRTLLDTLAPTVSIVEVEEALRRGGLVSGGANLRLRGTRLLQAAIAALHAEAPRWEDTDWRQIVLLYDQLLAREPSPIVELNRAVAAATVL